MDHFGTIDEECIDWLYENVGERDFLWKVENCTYLADHAKFWFWRDEDAVAFKLRWI